jgi:hypothetical protein
MLNPYWFLLDNIVNVLTGQADTDMLGDLADEMVADDGDVSDSSPTDCAQSIIDYRSAVQW